MSDPWFLWALIGIVCIGLEMLLPGFVIFFFGIGGLITALCCLVPFVSEIVWLQILLFITFSILSLVFLRRKFTKVFAGTVFDSHKVNKETDGVGKIADVVETVGSVTEGRIRFQGTTWKAHTKTGECLAGTHARIVSREGMTYVIEPVEEDAIIDGGKK